MRGVIGLIGLFVLAGCATAPPERVQPADGSGLSGNWIVDLSGDPDDPYTQPMNLMLNADGTVTGSFYNSEIENGRWDTGDRRLCVSFRTTDGAGPYHTAACLVGEVAEGQTWAEHRNFLFNWRAARSR